MASEVKRIACEVKRMACEVDAATKLPIPNVNTEIWGEGISRLSTDRGYNRVQNLTAGRHSLTAKHPNFVTQTVNYYCQ